MIIDSACLKQERLLHEVKKTTETKTKENCLAPISAGTVLSGSKALTKTETSNASTMSSSPKLSAPLFKKKDRTQEGANDGINKNAMVNASLKVKQTGDETSDKVGKEEDTRQVQAPHSHVPSVKSSNKHGVNKSEASLMQSTRPSNPFLKSSIK